MTLYYTTLDTSGISNISGATLATWPVFNASSAVVPVPLSASDFGSITRTDGTKQTTYKGWPLYYYAVDKATGDTNGNGVGGVWYVVNPTSLQAAPAASSSDGSNYPY